MGFKKFGLCRQISKEKTKFINLFSFYCVIPFRVSGGWRQVMTGSTWDSWSVHTRATELTKCSLKIYTKF